LDSIVNVEQRNSLGRFRQTGSSVSPGVSLYQFGPPKSQKQAPNHHRIGADAESQRAGMHHVAAKREGDQDMKGEMKLLVDHNAKV